MSDAFTNHLISEKSPYLQQHAHNPVDWYPWGEEAFNLAKELDRPIFLSIGYATCHWCHVMEKESFENLQIAKMMNEAFINIKVDREEHPEVDSLYMEFAQALMANPGGWPLNVMLTPDLKPFFSVTYLPPKTKHGLIGLDQFIIQISSLWQSDERPYIIEQANTLVEIFARSTHLLGEDLPPEELIDTAALQLFELADPVYGGIKGEPKFPFGYPSIFLMTLAKQKQDARALFFVELTLDRMAQGGIYDHLGGGFSRYSVDERWIIPHFEKMLYDNAILAKTYLEAWRLLKKESYARVVKETLDYVLREMRDSAGGFYSAEDADIEGHEGLFYTWSFAEIQETLPLPLLDLFCAFYGVTKEGPFKGRNVLHINMSLETLAKNHQLSETELEKRLIEARELLFKKRQSRPKPFKDDKILTGWNGLMVDAFIHAGQALQVGKYTNAAVEAANFIKTHLWKEGHLLRRYREGEARFHASLEEYAYLIKGILSLFEAGLGTDWLTWAIEMAAILKNEFKAPQGAFYQTDGKEARLLRKCNFYDGAEPSGNALHAENLLRLYQITQEDQYLVQAEDILKSAKIFMETNAAGSCYHLMALQRYYDKKSATLVIALDEKATLDQCFTQLYTLFTPHTVLVWKKPGEEITLIPALADKHPIGGVTTVYLCRQQLCEAPIVEKEALLKAIETL